MLNSANLLFADFVLHNGDVFSVLDILLSRSYPRREERHRSLGLAVFLKTKLCRRLVKLEIDKERAPVNLSIHYEYWFTATVSYEGSG